MPPSLCTVHAYKTSAWLSIVENFNITIAIVNNFRNYQLSQNIDSIVQHYN